MPALNLRSLCILGFGFWLIAAASAPALAAGGMNLRNAQVEPLSFSALDGWKDDDHAAAFDTFLKSCGAILNGTKAMRSARPVFGALFKVCERAAAAGQLDRDHARAFFEDNFKPVRVTPAGQTEGFFTGYYETEVDGSRFPSDEYTIPIYAAPAETVKRRQSKVFSDLDRTKIEDGALAGKELEICYVKNPIDAFFAQIQGSTRVKLDNGKLLRLNYIASNGQPYTPVGKFLIDRGIVSKEEMSMDKIRDFMEANPEEGKELRRKNRSFVFFQETTLGAHDECIGAQGVPLTPGRSLAVDKRIHVYGTPIWIDAESSDRQRKTGNQIPSPAVCAGYRLGNRRAGARRYLFRPWRGNQPHRRPHQAIRPIRNAGPAERDCKRRRDGGGDGYPATEAGRPMTVTAAARATTATTASVPAPTAQAAPLTP